MWDECLEITAADLIQRLAKKGLDKVYDLETLTFQELADLAVEYGVYY